MEEVIERIQAFEFVKGIRSGSGKTIGPSPHLFIEVSKDLMYDVILYAELQSIISNQDFFEWTIVS